MTKITLGLPGQGSLHSDKAGGLGSLGTGQGASDYPGSNQSSLGSGVVGPRPGPAYLAVPRDGRDTGGRSLSAGVGVVLADGTASSGR